jgi:hypothetical protein
MESADVEQIEACLTLGGRFPLSCSFSDGEFVYVWADSGRLRVLKAESDVLYKACLEYLRVRGRQFDSVDSGLKAAIDHKWLHWEKLQVTYKTQEGNGTLRIAFVEGNGTL